IYRNGTQLTTTTSTTYTDTGLTASTLYSYTVAAYDAAGNTSTQSSAASATTLPVAPLTCTSFTYSAYSACQSNNTQSRTTTSSSPTGCTGGTPVLTQACTYTPPAPPTQTVCNTFTYSLWGACQSNNTQSRTTTATSPSGCTGGTPVLSQACTYTPPAPPPVLSGGGGSSVSSGSSGSSASGASSGGGSSSGGSSSGGGSFSAAPVPAPAPHASGLTSAQIQAILSLLSSFGADSATVANVSAILSGTTPPATAPSTPSTSTTLSANLFFGSRGTQVTALQQILIKLNLLSVSPTGYYGSLTMKAVETFQSTYGIVSSGSPATTGYGAVGPRTRTKLNEIGMGR
ncbi:MAG: peptidoglycan-binding domain-containing protein, partial [Minisyncoccota bacterium]